MVVKCEKCGAMYILSDEKLKAQEWKLPCTKCQHVTQLAPPGEGKPEGDKPSLSAVQAPVKEAAPVLPQETAELLNQFKANPKSKTFFPVAEYYFKEGKFEDAVNILNEGLKHNPAYLTARLILGRTYVKLERWKEAVSELERVCNQSRENTLAQKNLAIALKALGRIEEARRAIDVVKMFEPKDIEADNILKELIKSGESLAQPEESATHEPKSEVEMEQPADSGLENILQAPEEESIEKETADVDISGAIDDLFAKAKGATEFTEGPAKQEEKGLPEEGAFSVDKEPLEDKALSNENLPVDKDVFEEESRESEEGLPVDKDIFDKDLEEGFGETGESKLPEEGSFTLGEDPSAELASEMTSEEPQVEDQVGESAENAFNDLEKRTEDADSVVEGFNTGRFDAGVTADGVIEDVFKEEEGVEIEPKAEQEPLTPQLDEEILAETRPKVVVSQPTGIYTAGTAAKETQKKIKIKPLYLLIFAGLLILSSATGFYYWEFEYTGTQPNVEKLITVSKGILKANEGKKIEAERLFTEATVAYSTDSVNGYLKSYDLFKRCIVLDHNNPKYFALLAESAAELSIFINDKRYLDESNMLSSRALEMAPDNHYSQRAIAHFYKVQGKPSEALVYITKAISTDTKDINALILQGEIQSMLPESLSDAEVSVNEAQSIRETAPGYYLLGKIYENKESFDLALTNFKKAVSLHPDYLKAILSAAGTAQRLGLYADAETLLTQAYSGINKFHIIEQKQIYLSMASLNLEIGKLENAKSDLEEVLKISKSDVQAFLMLGDVSVKLNRYEDAAGYYENALKIEPQNPEANYLAGTVYVRIKKYTQAIERLKKAVEGQPKEFKYHLGLGIAYLYSDQLNDSLTELKKAQEIDPKNSDVLYNLCNVYLKKGEKETALEVARKAVASAPDSIDARMALSRTYEQLERNPEAKAELEKAIKLDPKNGKPYSNLSRIFLKEGNIASAFAYGEKAVSLSKDPATCRTFADILEKKGNTAGAIEYLLKAIEMEPYNYFNYYRLGEIYYSKKDLNNALKAFQDSVSHNSTDLLSNFNIGRALEDKGELDNAYAQYEKVISNIDNKFSPAYFRMGIISEKKNDISKSISKYEKSVEFDKSRAEYFYYLGKAQYSMNDFVKAQHNLESAVKLAPEFAPSHLVLGMVYDYLGDYQRALHEYAMSLKLSPQNAEPLIKTANILRAQGEYAKSFEVLKQAMKVDPSRPSLYYSLGLLYEEKGELERAMDSYKRAISRDANYPEPYYNLGFMYSKLGRNSEARENLLKTLSLGIGPAQAKKAKEALAKLPQ